MKIETTQHPRLRLADELVDNILSLSDEEILAQAAEDYDDPKQVAQEVRDLINSVVLEHRRRKVKP